VIGADGYKTIFGTYTFNDRDLIIAVDAESTHAVWGTIIYRWTINGDTLIFDDGQPLVRKQAISLSAAQNLA